MLSFKRKLLYLMYCAKYFKEIFLNGRLLAADKKIAKDIGVIKLKNHSDNIVIPFREIEDKLSSFNKNDYCSLELIREIFLNNEYLRYFKKSFNPQVVVDIGANRGFFSLLAHKKYNPKKLIKIEPQEFMSNIFSVVSSNNLLNKDSISEYYSFCTAHPSTTHNFISINTLFIKDQIDQIDLLKMDIEGAEVDIFSDNTQWLEKCNNITMELHFFDNDTSFIPQLLREYGFQIKLANLEGYEKPIEILKKDPRRCCYLYASKNNQFGT